MAKTVKELTVIVEAQADRIEQLYLACTQHGSHIEQLQGRLNELTALVDKLNTLSTGVEKLIEQSMDARKNAPQAQPQAQPQVQQQRRTVEEGGWAPRLGKPGTECECKRCQFLVRVNEYGACPDCYTVAAEARKQYRNRQAA